MTGSGNQPGAADDAAVDQRTGAGSGASGEPVAEPSGGGGGRDVGIPAAVERGPAETTTEGEPVPENPHISLEDREPARSTDDL
jgi:hypothetical protein